MFAELSNYLDDELDNSLCEELEKHMDGCEPCKAFLSSLEKSIQQCHMAPNDSPDPRITRNTRLRFTARFSFRRSHQVTRRYPYAGFSPQAT
jgi:anti-sigma factor RsiW